MANNLQKSSAPRLLLSSSLSNMRSVSIGSHVHATLRNVRTTWQTADVTIPMTATDLNDQTAVGVAVAAHDEVTWAVDVAPGDGECVVVHEDADRVGVPVHAGVGVAVAVHTRVGEAVDVGEGVRVCGRVAEGVCVADTDSVNVCEDGRVALCVVLQVAVTAEVAGGVPVGDHVGLQVQGPVCDGVREAGADAVAVSVRLGVGVWLCVREPTAVTVTGPETVRVVVMG